MSKPTYYLLPVTYIDRPTFGLQSAYAGLEYEKYYDYNPHNTAAKSFHTDAVILAKDKQNKNILPE